MKILTLAIAITFCINVHAESSSAVSIGISVDDFIKQGGKLEQKSESFGDIYRVNIDKFENCSPTEVIAKSVDNEEMIYRKYLKESVGWYEFGAQSKVDGKNLAYVQIRCAIGIPYRNVWF